MDKFKQNKVLASIESLELYLGSKQKLIIRNTNLKIRENEVLGLIGESGSGKTVITTSLTGLNVKDQLIKKGKIILNDIDVTNFSESDWNEAKLRGNFISQVFQNPLSSLNPYRKIGIQIIESVLTNNPKLNKKEAYEIAIKLLSDVKIKDPEEIMKMYPHQMSGGMNQRIVIVIILAANPKLIIFDEPTTALDPVAQAQIIEIIRKIKTISKTAMIFISHDIALVSSIADTIAIMYAGKIIEQGSTKEIINHPLHPYTWGLLMSIPEFIESTSTSKETKLYSIPGIVPSNLSEIKGDAFAPRSSYALKIDFELEPPRYDLTESHFVYSWLYDQKTPNFEPPKLIKKRYELYFEELKKEEEN